MGETTQRRRIEIFYGRDGRELGPEMMPREGIDEAALAGLAKLAEVNYQEGVGERNRVLFSEPGEQGMSLLHIWFKSGYVLPFHSHNVDCLYYILGGELRMGSHTLCRGDGFFLPADHGYGYEAGPEGVDLLEFRNATRFNFLFRPNNEARWDRMARTFQDRAAIWETEAVPPSER